MKRGLWRRRIEKTSSYKVGTDYEFEREATDYQTLLHRLFQQKTDIDAYYAYIITTQVIN